MPVVHDRDLILIDKPAGLQRRNRQRKADTAYAVLPSACRFTSRQGVRRPPARPRHFGIAHRRPGEQARRVAGAAGKGSADVPRGRCGDAATTRRDDPQLPDGRTDFKVRALDGRAGREARGHALHGENRRARFRPIEVELETGRKHQIASTRRARLPGHRRFDLRVETEPGRPDGICTPGNCRSTTGTGDGRVRVTLPKVLKRVIG